MNDLQPLPPISTPVLHWLFLLMAGGVLLMSSLMSTQGSESVFLPGFQKPMPITCSTKALLGLDCPGCGLTRSFIAISHGQFVQAWQFHRVGIFVYAFVAAQLPWHTVQLWRLKNRRPLLNSASVYIAPIVLAVLLAANWIWKLCC